MLTVGDNIKLAEAAIYTSSRYETYRRNGSMTITIFVARYAISRNGARNDDASYRYDGIFPSLFPLYSFLAISFRLVPVLSFIRASAASPTSPRVPSSFAFSFPLFSPFLSISLLALSRARFSPRGKIDSRASRNTRALPFFTQILISRPTRRFIFQPGVVCIVKLRARARARAK